MRHCLQWTDLVVTVSESSKRDIVQYLNVEADRIWVTPLASQYQPLQIHPEQNLSSQNLPSQNLLSPTLSSATLSSQSLQNLPAQTSLIHSPKTHRASRPAYDLKRPFLLFVSTIEPRKNITNLIKSFNILKSCHHIDHDLVLIGKKGWSYGPIFEEIARSPWRSQIFHLDYLPDHQVQQFYRHAQAFIYPSHYEGFGLPVLEAMTFGVPVITANASSLPEVGGQAAIYIDPQDPEAIATQVYRVLADSVLRQSLAIQGQQQARKFSWEATARETLRAYRSLC
ncbi:MAG: glycosyltransferase family 4 protein [Synechococcales cyanobacterium CRU_2_2]|nr:glycosyltransferase family 4 protein [Synechococcales cyanobacterium CRU_2_2]